MKKFIIQRGDDSEESSDANDAKKNASIPAIFSDRDENEDENYRKKKMKIMYTVFPTSMILF